MRGPKAAGETEVRTYAVPIDSNDVALKLIELGVLPKYTIKANIFLEEGAPVVVEAEFLVPGCDTDEFIGAFKKDSV